MLRRVLLDLPHHAGDLGIAYVMARAARWHVVVGHAEGEPGLSDRDAPFRQLGEGMKRALMHEVTIDPEQRIAVLTADDLMGRP